MTIHDVETQITNRLDWTAVDWTGLAEVSMARYTADLFQTPYVHVDA